MPFIDFLLIYECCFQSHNIPSSYYYYPHFEDWKTVAQG